MKNLTFIYQINCKMNIKYRQDIDKVINNYFIVNMNDVLLVAQ